jgi:hypothetical protein
MCDLKKYNALINKTLLNCLYVFFRSEYQKIFTCIQERGKKYCDDKELNEAQNLIRSMTGGVLGSLCTDYRDGSDKCQQLGIKFLIYIDRGFEQIFF